MNDTAATILLHLSPQGQQGLHFMLGAGPFVTSPNSVSFRFKGSRKVNHAEIVLNGSDTYDLILSRVGGDNESTPVIQVLDLYDHALRPAFEQETVLITAIPKAVAR